METTETGWRVLDREAGVLVREYRFSKGGEAWCFVARMGDGTLMVVSPALGMDEGAHAELSEFGEVGAVVAPNGFHHMAQAHWRERYPGIPHYAPVEAMARIAKKNPTAGELLPLLELQSRMGDSVGIHEVADTKCGESWAWAKIEGGHAFYAADSLINVPQLPPMPFGLLFWMTKSAPGYRPFNLGLKFIVKDRKATLRALRDQVEKHPTTLMVPGHGQLLTGDDLQERTLRLLDEAL